jgi:transposase
VFKQSKDMLSQRNYLTLFYLFEFEQNVRSSQEGVSRISNQETKRREIFHFLFLNPSKNQFGMKKIVKQIAAIDVAQEELVVCLGRMYDDWSPQLYANKSFANTKIGMEVLEQWVKKQNDPTVEVRFVMEATGVYHEALAYFLDERGYELSIVLPNKISNYMRTLDIKTITDKTASQAIAMFGLERKLDNWKRPKEIYRKLRQLSRERDQIVGERTVIKNQLHAEKTEVHPGKSSIRRMNSRLAMLDRQEKEIRAELSSLIATDQEVQKIILIICSLPGVALLTAATVLGETNGFDLIRNRRQLASYAGFDVIEKQSGTSVRSKGRISKKGNRYLRKAMHMPALTAIRSNERFKAIFARLVSKHGIKMKAAVAIQRKLLEMTYILCKTNKRFDKNYLLKETNINKKLERSV